MHRFYADDRGVNGDMAFLCEEDARHATRVLRMKPGEGCELFADGKRFSGEILSLDNGEVEVRITGEMPSTEARLRITLYQGLPKADKMELIIQKAVELGVAEIVPVVTKRTIVKAEEGKSEKKQNRWQAIAESAAKQSGRGVIPRVAPICTWKEALAQMKDLEYNTILYENARGMQPTTEFVKAAAEKKSIGIFVGPEGGFTEEEVAAVTEQGAECLSLGKRILRTETAGLAMLSMLMLSIECAQE